MRLSKLETDRIAENLATIVQKNIECCQKAATVRKFQKTSMYSSFKRFFYDAGAFLGCGLRGSRRIWKPSSRFKIISACRRKSSSPKSEWTRKLRKIVDKITLSFKLHIYVRHTSVDQLRRVQTHSNDDWLFFRARSCQGRIYRGWDRLIPNDGVYR